MLHGMLCAVWLAHQAQQPGIAALDIQFAMEQTQKLRWIMIREVLQEFCCPHAPAHRCQVVFGKQEQIALLNGFQGGINAVVDLE
jgi:hypothetical protein